jgi:hypothetical protein
MSPTFFETQPSGTLTERAAAGHRRRWEGAGHHPPPKSYPSEGAARATADWLAKKIRPDGVPYVYRCKDHRAWHVGVDTGAPYHTGRDSCEVSW